MTTSHSQRKVATALRRLWAWLRPHLMASRRPTVKGRIVNMQTAAMLRHRHLYNYQRFDLGRLSRIIETKTIYCANPKDFNDPWDCRPWFDTARLDDPTVHAAHVRWFDRVDRTHFPKSEAEHRLREQRLRTDRSFLISMIDQVSREIESAIHSRYRVYCVSTKPDSTLMWAHYAANHTGLCLEFATDNLVFSGALKVEYLDRYPSHSLIDDSVDTALLPLTTKSDSWGYEDEFRVLAEERAVALDPVTLKTDNNFLTLPPGALKSVILGCTMPHYARAAIHDLVARLDPAIAIKRAVRVPNRYDLRIEA